MSVRLSVIAEQDSDDSSYRSTPRNLELQRENRHLPYYCLRFTRTQNASGVPPRNQVAAAGFKMFLNSAFLIISVLSTSAMVWLLCKIMISITKNKKLFDSSWFSWFKSQDKTTMILWKSNLRFFWKSFQVVEI